MKKMPFLFMLLLIPAIAFSMGPDNRKPQPPLKVSIAPASESLRAEDIRPGDEADFKATALSMMDAGELRMEVKLTGGAELISGETKWSGPLKKGEEKTLLIRVRAPFKGAGMIRASVFTVGEPRFRAQAIYRLGGGPKEKETPPPVKKDIRGREIIEYPAN